MMARITATCIRHAELHIHRAYVPVVRGITMFVSHTQCVWWLPAPVRHESIVQTKYFKSHLLRRSSSLRVAISVVWGHKLWRVSHHTCDKITHHRIMPGD